MHHDRKKPFLLLSMAFVMATALPTGCKEAEEAVDHYAIASAAPTAVDFGVVQLTTQRTQTIRVESIAVDDVLLESVTLEGDDMADFAWVVGAGGSSGPWTVGTGAPLELTVTFTPGAEGDRAATLRLDFAEDGDTFHVLGGGCAEDPNFEPGGPVLQPAPLMVPLRGTGSRTGVPGACTDEDGDGYQILEPDGCDPWVNVPPGGGPPKLEPPVCDTDENRHPDQSDPCDGTDDDCDGTTDEDFESEAVTCGVGDCENSGLTICIAGEVRDECEPLAPPTLVDESCDRRDSDCDSQTDEDFDDSLTTCGTGACAATGEETCADGVVSDDCVPGDPPEDVDTSCDDVDTDCDGDTDEEYEPETVTCGTGACVNTGTSACVDGEELPSNCTPLTPPATTDDSCDGVDSDCDGQTDEEFVGGTVTCGLGACQREGSVACVDGEEIVVECIPGDPLGPTDPTCDGVDDDCDGETDEEWVAENVTCGAGVCERTVQNSCVDGAVVTPACEPGDPLGETDPTCDGVDDDCDGATDEEFEGGTTTCGVGACERTGSTTCVDGEEVVDECVPGEPLSLDDPTCDNVDDDCDGETDEDFVGEAVTCGTGFCEREGGVLCVDGQVEETECVPGDPLSQDDPTCDNVDDNCNGATDEDYVPELVTCGTGVCVNEGLSACADGAVVPGDCVPLDPPTDVDDDCDLLDDDCDGETDEEFVEGVITCGLGLCLREGTRTCIDGDVVDDCTPGEPAAVDDPCTDLDEDCDGATDEDLPLAGGSAGCDMSVPVLWDGSAEPAISDDCLGFTSIGVETGTVTITTNPSSETAEVGPGVEVRDGALWVRTLPVDVQLWYELEFTYPLAGQTVAAQVTVELDDYLGDVASPGAALYLSNGSHGVWLNVVRHGVYVYTGEGPALQELGFIEALTQSVPHTVRLVLTDDAHVRVEIDGVDRVTFPDALLTAATDPVPRVRFGDWSETAGALVGWDDLALFNLPAVQLDADTDGVDVCHGDCDDTDAGRSPQLVDDPCTTVDEDCNPDTGLTPEGAPGAIGGLFVDGCEDATPVLWDGTVLPEEQGGCLPFQSAIGGAEPAVTFEAGALRLESAAPEGIRTWATPWPDALAPAGAWLVAQARVHVIAYVGATDQPGNALFVANGASRVWLNIAADRLVLLGGVGAVLGEVPFDTTLAFHDYGLAVAPNGDVFVTVDDRTVLSLAGGAAGGEPTALIEAGFGDAVDGAGATAHWDDFGFFALANAGRIDQDGDGFTGCGGDCDDADPAIHPQQGEQPGDLIDQNCDGDPDDIPYCAGPTCLGPLPDPDPIPGTDGCYRVFEYPDGWNGGAEDINMGQSGGTLGDVNDDGVDDIGFNHDDEVYIRFGEPAAFGLGTVPEDPLAVAPTGVDVVIGSAGEPVSQLGLSGVTGGDLNGDGLNDVVIGTRFATDANDENVGRVYVFIGREDWNGFYDAAEANLIIEKSGLDGWTASSVTVVNDLNGDGRAEIGIKAKDAFTSRDRFYLFFGDAAWTTATSLTLTNDEADVRYIDPVTYFVTGVGDAVNIASAGDFDGDGYNDMALGTPGRDGGRGAVFLVFGGEGDGYWPTTPVELAVQPNVLRFDRPDLVDPPVTGAHVAQGGDLNADGFSDLVFTGRHILYVVPGRSREDLLAQLGVPALGVPGLIYNPADQGDYLFTDADDTYPFDLAFVGDVDGDGFDDVLVSTGNFGGPGGDLTNVSYLLYGAPVLDWPLASEIRVTYDACFHHGESLASAHVGRGGDFNADGMDDMVFAAPLRQEVRVLYGDWY